MKSNQEISLTMWSVGQMKREWCVEEHLFVSAPYDYRYRVDWWWYAKSHSRRV